MVLAGGHEPVLALPVGPPAQPGRDLVDAEPARLRDLGPAAGVGGEGVAHRRPPPGEQPVGDRLGQRERGDGVVEQLRGRGRVAEVRATDEYRVDVRAVLLDELAEADVRHLVRPPRERGYRRAHRVPRSNAGRSPARTCATARAPPSRPACSAVSRLPSSGR